jgi:hypothetical protein
MSDKIIQDSSEKHMENHTTTHNTLIRAVKGIIWYDNVHFKAEIHRTSSECYQLILRYAYPRAYKSIRTITVFESSFKKLLPYFKYFLSLKYNRIGPLFIDTEDIKCAYTISSSSSVQLCWDDCSVCLESTDCVTVCGHYLCLQCHSQMVLTNRPARNTKCPLCRHTLSSEH